MSKETNHNDKQRIKGKSRYADCIANKSFSDEIKHKSELEIIVFQFLIN